MWHPLASLPAEYFWPLLFLTLIVLLLFQLIDKPLKTGVAPQGIVSYELAGDVAKAQAIVDSWDERARIYAGFSLGFDYLFMLLYATTIAMACLWSAAVFEAVSAPLAMLGSLAAWGILLAAVLDGVENYALFRMLTRAVADPWPAISRWCASIKFLLVAIGILYGVAGGIASLLL